MLFLRQRRRIAASEPIAAIIAIAMTLIAGAATWGWVNRQAGVSEGALQSNYLGTDNFLTEQFKVVDMYFSTTQASGSSCAGSNYCSAVFWVYNVGGAPLNVFSVRLYDSAGLVNILYNYTQSGSTKTDQVYDQRSTLSSKCKLAGSSYESPTISATTVKLTSAATYTLTIPTAQGSCTSDPSYGQTFATGTTYYVVVTGVFGNVITNAVVK